MSTISVGEFPVALNINSKQLSLGNSIILQDNSNAKQETLIGLAVPLAGVVESTADQVFVT